MMTITPPETSWTTTTLTGRRKPTSPLPTSPAFKVKSKSTVIFSYFTHLLTETVFLRLPFFFCNVNLPSVFSLFDLVFYFSEFPPIANEPQRSNYKHEFDRDHQEYKDLQAELDAINKNLSDVDRELDELQEGSPQYLVRADRKKKKCFYSLLYTAIFIHD